MWRFEKRERYSRTEIYSWNGKFEIDVYSRIVYRQKIRQIFKITRLFSFLVLLYSLFRILCISINIIFHMYPAFPPKDPPKDRSFPPLKIFYYGVSGAQLLNFWEIIESFGGVLKGEWRMILLWVFFGWFTKKKSIVE